MGASGASGASLPLGRAGESPLPPLGGGGCDPEGTPPRAGSVSESLCCNKPNRSDHCERVPLL
eukprot:1175748-Prorocentrum_minimum.AAC.2